MADITGTDGNDRLEGTEGDDTIRGLGGDDALIGLGGDDTLNGGFGNDGLLGGPGWDTLDGGPGEDWASYLLSLGGVTIDLSATPDANGYVRGAGGDAQGDRLKNIEKLQGSAFSDSLTGDGNNNSLRGDGGADTLDGGAGLDVAIYADSPAGVTIDLSATPDANGYVRAIGGDAQGDRLKNIENILGSGHADRLTGDGNDNALEGRDGDDTLNGGGGADTLYGGDGWDELYGGDGRDELYGGEGWDDLDGGPGADTLDGGVGSGDEAIYSNSPAGVTIDLSATPDAEGYVRGAGGDAEGDRLKNIEYLRGSDHADRLTGDGKNNRLRGGDGADTLDGGDGNGDWASYSGSDAGVTIDLSATPDAEGYVRGSGGDAEGDRLKNIEYLWGSDHADRLTGDDSDNELEGGGGDDTLNGGAGDDWWLWGGLGADTINGGSGDDGLYGSVGADTLNGGSGDDRLRGHGEDDMLNGGPGDDDLEGGNGDDTLNGGAGDDELVGDDGADRFVFDAGSGSDTITDFEPGIDMIEIRQAGVTFAGLRIEANGGNARVSWGDEGQSITLTDVADTDLTESAFLFSDAPQPDADVLTGTAGDDTLTGTAGADTLNGLAGDDTLNGGAGADSLNGGLGADTASYLDSDAGVLVRLHDASSVKFGHAEGDTLTDIEHLIGSRHNDTLAGDGGDNRLEGRDGNDVLYGGPAGGDDMMYGGNGDDRLFGGRGDDTLVGGAGFDYLKGGPGNDELVAGEGMDIMYGGAGEDTFVFSPGDVGSAVIADFSNGEDVIDLTAFAGIDSMDDLDRVSHGDNVRIELSGADYLTTIILSDFDINNLDDSDFLF